MAGTACLQSESKEVLHKNCKKRKKTSVDSDELYAPSICVGRFVIPGIPRIHRPQKRKNLKKRRIHPPCI